LFVVVILARLDPAFLARVSSRITNEVRGVNRVVYTSP
jgi:GMP synthase PP-ATPase subunit